MDKMKELMNKNKEIYFAFQMDLVKLIAKSTAQYISDMVELSGKDFDSTQLQNAVMHELGFTTSLINNPKFVDCVVMQVENDFSKKKP